MKNRLTEMLNVKYPIIQGGMMEISRAKLVAAVSNAGGLGTLGQMHSVDAWLQEIKKTKELTDKPFSVNLPMHVGELDSRLQIIMDEKIQVVTTAAGNPARIMPELKKAGVTVMHLVANLEQAVKVEASGVDVIVAEGGESGGMVGKIRVSTIVLIPEVAAAVKIPVVAAGGIADARGMVAAMALGAQGVQIGTRFLACEECEAPEKWKEAIVKARDVDTRVVPRGPAQGRVLIDELMEGAMAGVVVGLIHDIVPAARIVEEIGGKLEEVCKTVNDQLN